MVATMIGMTIGMIAFAGNEQVPAAHKKYDKQIEVAREKQAERISLETQLSFAKAEEEKELIALCLDESVLATSKLADNLMGFIQLTPEDKKRLIRKEVWDEGWCKENYKPMLVQKVYQRPADLFYTFLTSDGAYTTQSFQQHFSRNKYMAIDIGTSGKKLDIHAPSFMPERDVDLEMEYTVKLVHNYDTMGQTIELHFDYNDVHYNWAIGHVNTFGVKDGDIVKTGDIIGLSGGCIGELKEGEKSTGCHAHIEFRQEGTAVAYPMYLYTVHTPKELCEKIGVGEDQNQYVRMASEMSGNDLRFLSVLEGENGLWTPDRVHNDGHGRGFCGIDDRHHPELVDDPNFLDPEWQMRKCYELWTGGTTFYASETDNQFRFTCYN